MKTISVLALVLGIAVSQAYGAAAGPGGSGGGDLSGVLDSELPSTNWPDYVVDSEIAGILSGEVRRLALEYLDLLQNTTFDLSEEHRVLRELYPRLRLDIARMKLVPQNECRVNGRVTSMSTTQGVPAADVCINIPRIKQQIISAGGYRGFGNSLAALLVHEGARHMGLEDTTSDLQHPLSKFVSRLGDWLSFYRYKLRHSTEFAPGLRNIDKDRRSWTDAYFFAESSVQKIDLKFSAKGSCFPMEVEIYENPRDSMAVRQETIRGENEIVSIPMIDTYLSDKPLLSMQPGIQVKWNPKKSSCRVTLQAASEKGGFAGVPAFLYNVYGSGNILIHRIPFAKLP